MQNWYKPDFPALTVHVGRISYMNVAPVYYGLDNGRRPAWLKITSAPPSILNSMLSRGELDISPVSSVAYAQHQEDWLLLPDLSISCFGKVMSVLLVSKFPFNCLSDKKVILTEDSATAAALSKLIFALKNVNPLIETGKIQRFDDVRQDASAALVIGDAALREKWRSHFEYVWDLGDMWKEMTGLPFVFALWAVRKSFAEKRPEAVSSVIDQFHLSKKQGNRHIGHIVSIASKTLGMGLDICRTYYLNLHYDLTPLEIKGLEMFFTELYRKNLIPKPVQMSFFDIPKFVMANDVYDRFRLIPHHSV